MFFPVAGLLAQVQRYRTPSRLTDSGSAHSSPSQWRDRAGFTPDFPIHAFFATTGRIRLAWETYSHDFTILHFSYYVN